MNQKKIISTNSMNKKDLKKLSKSDLIKLLLKQDKPQPDNLENLFNNNKAMFQKTSKKTNKMDKFIKKRKRNKKSLKRLRKKQRKSLNL